MSELLQEAFNKASKLSVQEQDAFVRWILEELASELKWDQSFGASSSALISLANEALAERRKGQIDES